MNLDHFVLPRHSPSTLEMVFQSVPDISAGGVPDATMDALELVKTRSGGVTPGATLDKMIPSLLVHGSPVTVGVIIDCAQKIVQRNCSKSR